MPKEREEKIKQAIALEYYPKDAQHTFIAAGKGAMAERIIEKA